MRALTAGLVVIVNVVALGCAHTAPRPATIRARVVPPSPGVYHAHKQYTGGGPDIVDTVDVTIELREGGAAEVDLAEHFAAYGDLVRDDDKTFEMHGTWRRDGDRVDVSVVTKAACLSGFGERPCARSPEWGPTAWRLSCRAMVPGPDSDLPAPALVCEQPEGESIPRYTVVLDGVRVIVVGGPDPGGAIRYTYD